MPMPAFNRLTRTRAISAGGVVIAGAIALTGVVMPASAEAATPSTTAVNASATTTPAGGSQQATYTVGPGDTLTGIASAHNVSQGWSAIATLNNIASPYIIYPGEVLKLPGGSSNATSTNAVPASYTTSATTKTATAQPATAHTYANNLNGWIEESLAIMQQNGIPGSYNGIYRNVMRESSGNPNAINLWDSNAAAGHPSIGLLQVIQPTFTTYHVPGTSWNIYDPVANITAACNYAAHRYGSIDNVNGPY